MTLFPLEGVGPRLFEARCWSSCVWVFLVRLKQKMKTCVLWGFFFKYVYTFIQLLMHIQSFWNMTATPQITKELRRLLPFSFHCLLLLPDESWTLGFTWLPGTLWDPGHVSAGHFPNTTSDCNKKDQQSYFINHQIHSFLKNIIFVSICIKLCRSDVFCSR